MFKQKMLAGFITLVMLVAMILPVYADEISDQQNLLEELNQQMNQQQNNLNNASKAEKTIMGQVQGIEKDVSKTQKEIRSLSDQVNYLQNNIAVTEKQIIVQQKEMEKQAKLLSDRLVFIYEQGESSYLEVLLSANDIKDFLSRFDMLNSIVEQDKDLISSLNSKKTDLDMKKSDLEVQKRELQVAKESQEGKKQILASQLSDKKLVLTDVQQEKEKFAQAMEELEQASRQAEAMIRKLQGNGKGARIGTGSYIWPTPGYSNITSPFGMRFHPILKTRKLHTGVDIGAPYGVDILAADGGTVIFSGWLGAYGQAIIIDHGAGMSTLYGHQSELLVSEGEGVFKGQTIGRVGSTGWSTGAHLHFEVRINGSPVDPMGYV
ncbi:MAG: peptidase M23 [Firmicutes bacterium HGW-Firmicutes-15]|nr:MAG: peptidase M23 [Firmicutes bacterium HGW-Firmicutes-15]